MEDANNKGTSGRIIFFVFLVAVLGAFYYFSRPVKDGTPSGDANKIGAVGGQIIYVDGAVEYKTAGGEWTRAKTGINIGVGDSVEILGLGKAIINLDDGSAVRLNSDTGVTFASLDPDHIIINNDKGQVYTRVATFDRIFEVKSADAVYQSVGTAYKTINEEKLKGVEVYESKVKILGLAEKEILVEQGSKYYVLNKDDQKAEKVFIKIAGEDIAKDDFIAWNKIEDAKMGEAAKIDEASADESVTTTTEKPAADAVKSAEKASVSGIALTAKAVSGGVSLSWTVNGVDTPMGFKIVKSTEINPVYPGDDYIYLSEAGVRTYKWAITDGKTYYFRVCQYLGGKCGTYSNNVKLAVPSVEKKVSESEGATSISVSSQGGGQIIWRTAGESSQGFKVVYSKNSGPTYPTRDGDKYQYFTDPKQTTATIDAFDGNGLYYVRVCEYLGGKCGVYSNQIQVSL